jgi:hypothetical protein
MTNMSAVEEIIHLFYETKNYKGDPSKKISFLINILPKDQKEKSEKRKV